MPTRRIEFVDSMTLFLGTPTSVLRNTIEELGVSPTYYAFFIPEQITISEDEIFENSKIILNAQSDPSIDIPVTWSSLSIRPPQGITDWQQLNRISSTNFSTSLFDSSQQAHIVPIQNKATLQSVLDNGIKGVRNAVHQLELYSIRASAPLIPYIEYTYYDKSTPPEVTAQSPKDIIVDGDISNLFTWTYSQAAAAPQTHIDMQYLYAGVWQNIAEKIPLTAQQYTVPAGMLKPGATTWQVRAYCDDGNTVSEWAQADITVKAKPGDPTITGATSYPRPSIAWTDDGQQSGYQIRITTVGIEADVLDTGTVFNQNRFWRPQQILADGKYTVYLRVVNSDMVWSDWVSVDITVANVPGAEITLRSENTRDFGVKLEWETSGSYDSFVLIRNGKPFAATNKTSYTDYMSVGAASYMVRGVYGEYYTDSNERGACVKIHNAAISRVDEISWLTLQVRRNARPAHGITMAPDVTYLRFENRPRPQKETSDSNYMEVEHSYTYTFKERESYLKLLGMENQIVILKDCHGDLVVGNMTFSPVIDNVYEIEIIITETDIKDGLTYV